MTPLPGGEAAARHHGDPGREEDDRTAYGKHSFKNNTSKTFKLGINESTRLSEQKNQF
jgi:hypothetical protein